MRASGAERKANRRRFLWTVQGGRCLYCMAKVALADATLDHVIPMSKGGSDSIDNLVIACATCNLRRGNRSVRWFLKATAGKAQNEGLSVSSIPVLKLVADTASTARTAPLDFAFRSRI